MAARELGHVNLMNALALVVVYARASPKFEPAAVRWLARLALEFGRELGWEDCANLRHDSAYRLT